MDTKKAPVAAYEAVRSSDFPVQDAQVETTNQPPAPKYARDTTLEEKIVGRSLIHGLGCWAWTVLIFVVIIAGVIILFMNARTFYFSETFWFVVGIIAICSLLGIGACYHEHLSTAYRKLIESEKPIEEKQVEFRSIRAGDCLSCC